MSEDNEYVVKDLGVLVGDNEDTSIVAGHTLSSLEEETLQLCHGYGGTIVSETEVDLAQGMEKANEEIAQLCRPSVGHTLPLESSGSTLHFEKGSATDFLPGPGPLDLGLQFPLNKIGITGEIHAKAKDTNRKRASMAERSSACSSVQNEMDSFYTKPDQTTISITDFSVTDIGCEFSDFLDPDTSEIELLSQSEFTGRTEKDNIFEKSYFANVCSGPFPVEKTSEFYESISIHNGLADLCDEKEYSRLWTEMQAACKAEIDSCTGTDEVLFVSEEEYYEKFMEDLDRINNFASPEEEEELYQDHSYYTNIQSNDTKNNINGNQPLYSGATITVTVSVLLIMSFAVRHSLSGEALADLLNLIILQCIEPVASNALKSLFHFKKYFQNLKTPLVFHKYCSKCLISLDGVQNNSICPNTFCNQDISEAQNTSFFIEIPLLAQLQHLLSKKGFYHLLQYRFQRKKRI